MNFKFLTGTLLLACLISAQIVSSVPLTEDEVKQGLENTEQEIKDVLAGAENYVESILPESVQGKNCIQDTDCSMISYCDVGFNEGDSLLDKMANVKVPECQIHFWFYLVIALVALCLFSSLISCLCCPCCCVYKCLKSCCCKE